MKDETGQNVLIGGAQKTNIVIVFYQSLWPAQFQTLADTITAALGETALRIEHIGSTSVPGLAAKPIIDILLVVANSANEAGYLPQMEAAGYVLRVREPEFHEHRMFRTPQDDARGNAQIHVFSTGCGENDRYLTFRQRLRTNPAERQLYEQTKRRLAARRWPDMDAYANAKTEVIERIIAAAQAAGEVVR